MTPGSILFHRDFRFRDGTTANKYLAVLANDTTLVVAAVITSQGKRYGREYGCQPHDRYPCFHLPAGSCCLPKPSWIQLNAVHDLDVRKLLRARMAQRVVVLDDPLTPETTVALLKCVAQSEDITLRQEQMIHDELRKLCTP